MSASGQPRWAARTAEQLARDASVSQGAAQLFVESEVIDLHVDTYIWVRLFGYRIDRSHAGGGVLTGRFFSQVDLPRLRQTGIGGATWVITTNPARSPAGRKKALATNLERLGALLEAHPSDVGLAETHADYVKLRSEGKHAAFLGIQGGSALDVNLDAWQTLLPRRVLRVTLMHLYSSGLGRTSTPLANLHAHPLTALGTQVVEFLNAARIFVDLAHIDRAGFHAALDAHDPSLPPIVTHTGASGVHPHWRNIDDAQIRAIADRGGVVGVMYHMPFLGKSKGRGSLTRIVDHIEHVIRVGGEQCAALGSDWDGAITTPSDMPTCSELPRLVQEMLRRGFSEPRIRNVLGLNFLRCLRDLRG